MKFILSLVGMLLTVILLGGIALGVWGATEWRAPGPLPADLLVEIPHHTGVATIGQILADNHVVSSPLLFCAAVSITGRQRELKAGEYNFTAHMTLAAIIDKMARGDVFSRRFTIPEGLTSWQAMQIINNTPALSGTLNVTPAEGSLLPQTYQYLKGDVKQAAVQQMQDAMRTMIAELWPKRDMDLPFTTPDQAITLASIVEKETHLPAERPRIAGLFINRLHQNMPLQSDPTVIYALTKGQIQTGGMGPLGRHLLAADLTVDSPYNTYKYPGLPPGPIANPGRDSLLAVLHPEHNAYLYFVANGTGGHVFATTLEEHNKNVEQWRREKKILETPKAPLTK